MLEKQTSEIPLAGGVQTPRGEGAGAEGRPSLRELLAAQDLAPDAQFFQAPDGRWVPTLGDLINA